MSVRVIYDEKENMAAIYCSTSDVAFGPAIYGDKKMDAERLAWKFIQWLPQDSRQYDQVDLMSRWAEFSALNWRECPECFGDQIIPYTEEACDGCLHRCDGCGDRGIESVKVVRGTKSERFCGECARKKIGNYPGFPQ